MPGHAAGDPVGAVAEDRGVDGVFGLPAGQRIIVKAWFVKAAGADTGANHAADVIIKMLASEIACQSAHRAEIVAAIVVNEKLAGAEGHLKEAAIPPPAVVRRDADRRKRAG